MHYLQNDYTLVPEKPESSSDMSSNYSINITDKCGMKVGDLKKLFPNLGNKSKYVVHYRNL